MRKPINLVLTVITSVLFVYFPFTLSAQELYTDSAYDEEIQLFKYYDSIQSGIDFQYGEIAVNDVVNIVVPNGYKFIPRDKARMIVEDLWENPEDETILGMVVDSAYVFYGGHWAFIVSYEESGYVKDENADDIDYDEMLEDIQDSEEEINKERVKAGYSTMYILDWAKEPFYDHDKKILHWAKKIQFGDESMRDEHLTLNYDIRFLCRKGVLSMNAVGTMNQLDDINNHIPDILNTVEFKEGYTYSDFNPSIDKVAAYTIGGLIAGKLLAKTGIILLLLKNIKLILLAIAGFFGAFRKKIARFLGFKSKEEDVVPVKPHAHLENPDGSTLDNNEVDEKKDEDELDNTKE